jgi:hypothetical protein
MTMMALTAFGAMVVTAQAENKSLRGLQERPSRLQHALR